MSLHQLAHHLQSAGRGDDKVLVHMTPKEVGGLQALAMAHGGSLTINPETGLPEANFLKSLLPMLAGGALTVLSGGALSPLAASMIVGGGTALATGNLSKGLMAGLGAYGGAGLGAGLAKTGTAQLTAAEAAKVAGTTPTQNLSSSLWAKDPGIAAAGREFGVAGASAAGGAPTYTALDKLAAGTKALGQEGGFSNLYDALPTGTLPSLGLAAAGAMSNQKGLPPINQKAMIRPYEYTRTQNQGVYDMGAPMYAAAPGSSAEKTYFTDKYTALTPYAAPGPEYAADGGLVALAVGGPVEQMAALNSVGANTGYPMAQLQTPLYSNPAVQRPEAVNVISPSAEPAVGMYTGEQKFAGGGISHLGDYSDGGRLLKGPGDGVSDSIPAVIGQRQPARLADGEFVIPARIVSELGNGSTEAGARKLYKMMDRVQNARKKSMGQKKVAVDSRAEKLLPA